MRHNLLSHSVSLKEVYTGHGNNLKIEDDFKSYDNCENEEDLTNEDNLKIETACLKMKIT